MDHQDWRSPIGLEHQQCILALRQFSLSGLIPRETDGELSRLLWAQFDTRCRAQ